MPERLFLFLQMEFPWELGPPDGRYLLRTRAGGEPERVVVLGTLGARRRASARAQRRASSGRPGLRGGLQATPEPTPVATARATIVDPISLSAERQAHAWLADIDAEREARAAVAVLNRVLHYHRIASADPYIHEVSPAQALVIRAGWGEGEQVADGRWLHARELPWKGSAGTRRRGRTDRSAALRPQERLAELLSARGSTLLCEDIALRARLDLDQGRLAHAAIELQAAYASALAELRAEHRQDLAIRIAELEKLRGKVALQGQVALSVADPAAEEADATDRASATDRADTADVADRADTADVADRADTADVAGRADTGESADSADRSDAASADPDEEIVRHALERLEAALRARTATGF